MNSHIIEEMLDALSPALTSRKRAHTMLREFWSDKMALVWTTQDIHRAANERETVLTEEEARTALADLHRHHDKQLGIRWQDIVEWIEQSGLGRDITKRELSRFIHHDIRTIQKPVRRKGCP
jgi:hypothetical protein